MNLASAFAETAEQRRLKTAVYWGEEQFTYGDLLDQSRWLAAKLSGELGVRPGDRVAVWLRNCPQFIPTLFGIWNAGGVVVMINHFLKPDEIHYLLEDSGARVVISEAHFLEAQTRVSAEIPQLKYLQTEAFPRSPTDAQFPADPRTGEDLAALLYTSGTTGHPKGAMLTHGNFLHNVTSCLQCLEVEENDRLVVLLPQFHSFMFTVGTLLPMIRGASILLLKSLHPLRSVLEEIVHRRATILPAVPSFYRTLTLSPGSFQLPLRLCVSGGAPLPVEVLRDFEARFQLPLVEGYGPTETSPVATVNPIHGRRKPGSVGIPIPDVSLSIRNDAGDELPDGETGEICIRGGNVMQGYWKQPEETARVLRGGWLYTGDIGFRDNEGYYFITDRKKDMLIVNGINVYPREVEEVIYQFPGVKEAAVVGVPDPRRGEQPVAFVALTDGTSLDEKALLQFVRSKLADYKIPRRVTLMPALPRNATGKVLKTALRAMSQNPGG